MFARMSTFDWKPESIDDGIRNFKEQILPAVQKMAGFKKGYLLIDRQKSKLVTLTVFEREKDVRALSTAVNTSTQTLPQTYGAAKPPIVEIFEVPVQV